MTEPSAIILINGKRKCGKDFLASRIIEQLGPEVAETLHLSLEIKREYAQLHDLDFQLLLTDAPYKDTYRTEMIKLGEARRNVDPGHYCRLAAVQASKPCWIIVDNRRETDIAHFKSQYPGRCLVVRVCAREDVRRERGWVWKDGVDNVTSECGLDQYPWDVKVTNNGEQADEFQDKLQEVVRWVTEKLRG